MFFTDIDRTIELLSASKHANPECSADRQQLCEWLKELKRLREILDYQCKDCVYYSWVDCDHCGRSGTYDYKDENDKACKYFQLGE